MAHTIFKARYFEIVFNLNVPEPKGVFIETFKPSDILLNLTLISACLLDEMP